jgi:Flp pilus assembly protein TadG
MSDLNDFGAMPEQHFGQDKSGAVAVLIGFSAPMLMVAVALGVEVASWTVTEQKSQRTADAAALAAAEAYYRGASAQTAATYGAYVAEMNRASGAATRSWLGSTLSDGNITVQKTTGPVSSSDTAFLATIRTQVPLFFTAYVLQGSTTETITATATAEIITSQVGQYCALALDTAAETSVSITNGASITMNGCGLAVNSTGTASGSQALVMSGAAVLTDKTVTVVGSDSITNSASIVASGGVQTGAAQVSNPYSGVSVPSYSGCNHGSLPSSGLSLGHSNSGLQTISPGVYCGGLAMTNDADVQMTPGTYIINGGSFAVGGNVILAGSGVTIVLTGSGTNYATAQIGNGANVTLSAPTSGTTSGMLFFQDPNAPTSGNNNFQGGASENLTGALYFPHQMITYSNGNSSSSPCTALIGYKLTFTGGESFNNNCSAAGTSAIGPSSTVTLVR